MERLIYGITFTHEFVWDYDSHTETRSHSLLTLGSTPGSAVEEREEEDEGHPRGIDEGGD